MGSSTEMGSCVMPSLEGALQVSEGTPSSSQCKKITQECCLSPQGTFRSIPHSGLEGTTLAGDLSTMWKTGKKTAIKVYRSV